MIQTVGTSASNRLPIINTAQPAASQNTLPFDCAIFNLPRLRSASNHRMYDDTHNRNVLTASSLLLVAVVLVAGLVFIIRLHHQHQSGFITIADDVVILLHQHQPQAVSIIRIVQLFDGGG